MRTIDAIATRERRNGDGQELVTGVRLTLSGAEVEVPIDEAL